MEDYNKNDPCSIFEYSKNILGKCLRDYSPANYEDRAGKGGLGEMVEELFFHYQPNSNSNPDFEEAGVELKCTPLKKNARGDWQIKERLVCNMINYCAVVNEDFEHSHFYLKCKLMLILFYWHVAEKHRLDIQFLFSVLWKLPEKDLMIIRNDYDIIVKKIKDGKAETLSEGDTMYLGACRKGSKATDTTAQPNSNVPAPTRAFCLKMAYMRTVLQFVHESNDNAVTNYALPTRQLVTAQQLKEKKFEDIILERFNPYFGCNEQQLGNSLNVDLCNNPKNKFAMLANAIAASSKCSNVNRSEEFIKAGMQMKTIRMQAGGKIKEAMAFENINYQEVHECNDWVDSRLYEIFSSRFLFVVFKEQNLGKEDYVLSKVFFWTMPQKDLLVAEEYWNNIKKCVRDNTIDKDHFWKAADGRCFHVRPKARNSDDLAVNPNGGVCKKYCYWFNNDYITKIVDEKQ